ncbi:UDPGP type 1 family protein [bacterium]|nr:UDPGP type 1 family protein [bacterium]
MISGRTEKEQDIIEAIYNEGQGHVFRFWDELSDQDKTELINQLSGIDFNLIKNLHRDFVGSPEESNKNYNLEPAEIISIPRTDKQKKAEEEARLTGEKALADGRAAAFLVAGGQGTRLGFNGPKGCFPIAPVTGKTLFEVHADKILAAAEKYNVIIPWYIMTSEANHDATVSYFEENGFLGFNKKDVMFFKQEMLPAVDKNGRLILDSKAHVFMSPNGHGGSFPALFKSGALDDMEKRSIDIISYFQIDNVLVTIIDPVFIGYHIKQKAEMSSKMVEKAFPEEKVGVFGRVDNRLVVVEYSDLSRNDMYAVNQDGSLKYGAGSIAIHLINRDFVRHNMQEGMTLPFHVAHKKVPYVDEKGARIVPDEPNGYKFETFVFDALSRTTSSVIMEVAREDEFSPVKNREGEDSAETAKRDMSNFFGAWFEKTGVSVPRDAGGNVKTAIEISPFFAADEKEFKGKSVSEIDFSRPVYFGPENRRQL